MNMITCEDVFTVDMLDTSLVKKLRNELDSEAIPKEEVGYTCMYVCTI